MFGLPVEFNIDGQSKVGSKFGGCMTIFIYIIGISVAVISFYQFFTDNPPIVTYEFDYINRNTSETFNTSELNISFLVNEYLADPSTIASTGIDMSNLPNKIPMYIHDITPHQYGISDTKNINQVNLSI